MSRLDEKGITLPEVLASIVIAAIFGTLAYGILFSGIKANERVQAEAQLRDDADLIMTWFIQDLYTLRLSEINRMHFPEDANPNNYYIETTSGQKIGFINGKVQRLNGEVISLSEDTSINGSKIETVEDEQTGEIIEGLYRITLVLTKETIDETLEMVSEISVFRDIS